MRIFKGQRTEAVVVIFMILLLLPTMCFIDSFRYPRIARSAYWRRPTLLAKATITCLFPRKGISRKSVMAHAKQLRGKGDLNIRLLYLPPLPGNDKTIQARVFHLIAKRFIRSEENLFWIVSPQDCPNDDTLVYEYRTGRLVVCEDISRVGESADG